MVHIREIQHGHEVLLAACDHGLLGQVYREGEIVLDIKESFYGGETGDVEALTELFHQATIINLVGENCVAAAVESGLACEEEVLVIDGVPHLQIVRM